MNIIIYRILEPAVLQQAGYVLDYYHAYRSYPEYTDRQALANSVDPDQTPRNAASDQNLLCLSFIPQF